MIVALIVNSNRDKSSYSADNSIPRVGRRQTILNEGQPIGRVAQNLKSLDGAESGRRRQ